MVSLKELSKEGQRPERCWWHPRLHMNPPAPLAVPGEGETWVLRAGCYLRAEPL